jgi:hypothetical protein
MCPGDNCNEFPRAFIKRYGPKAKTDEPILRFV